MKILSLISFIVAVAGVQAAAIQGRHEEDPTQKVCRTKLTVPTSEHHYTKLPESPSSNSHFIHTTRRTSCPLSSPFKVPSSNKPISSGKLSPSVKPTSKPKSPTKSHARPASSSTSSPAKSSPSPKSHSLRKPASSRNPHSIRPSSSAPLSSTKPISSAHPSHSACVNSPTDRQCWGKYDINTDYYQNTPDTGVTREVFPFRA